jgi:predicted SAM-dependent methyltransferase
MKGTILVLGSAGKRHPEAITLDIEPRHKPDIVYDLNITPWPFPDNQFQEVICHHVLEHLNDFTSAMS